MPDGASFTPNPERNRRSPSRGVLSHLWHGWGLSIVLLALFIVSMVGQTWSGWREYNHEREMQDRQSVSLFQYLGTGHFGEATFENLESEFLQMAIYVLTTAFLYQRGSSESKRPDVMELVDRDPRAITAVERAQAPWPVQRGGLVLWLYENSLSLAFAGLFLLSFTLHAVTGARAFSEEQVAQGASPVTPLQFLASSRFWFQSFQNWQSEFLSLVGMVVLSIFLRQRGSPESKPVHAPTWDTGD